VVQGVDGMGYVTGEVSATDAATIDGMLAATARSLGATDPRTEQQRRADLFADLLLGRLTFNQSGKEEEEEEECVGDETGSDWLEVENIDPDTGELLGTQLQRINGDGEPLGEPAKTAPQTQTTPNRTPPILKRRETLRIGVVVPLSSLLGTDESPGELADRSGFIPGEVLRQHIAETLDSDSRGQVLFTRLLTDDGGRLLDVTELGRYASTRLADTIHIRAALHQGPIWIRSADDTTAARPSPGMLPSGTITASIGPCPTPNTTDASTSRYQQEWQPETPNLPTKRSNLFD
jgi:hypothetical protein